MERQKHFGLKRAWRTLPGLLCCVAAAAFSQTTEEKKLISGNTEFTFKLLKQLAKERPDASIFISPYSLSSALGFAARGAAGETKTELDAALGTTGMSGTAAAQAHDAIARAIKAGASNATFSVANAIWHAPNVQLKPDFVSLNQQYYQARLSALDFTDPRASGMVNR